MAPRCRARKWLWALIAHGFGSGEAKAPCGRVAVWVTVPSSQVGESSGLRDIEKVIDVGGVHSVDGCRLVEEYACHPRVSGNPHVWIVVGRTTFRERLMRKSKDSGPKKPHQTQTHPHPHIQSVDKHTLETPLFHR